MRRLYAEPAEMQYRIETAGREGVAITNYGMVIAYVLGILPRALKPFPADQRSWKRFFEGNSCQNLYVRLLTKRYLNDIILISN